MIETECAHCGRPLHLEMDSAPLAPTGRPERAASREGTGPGLSGSPNGALRYRVLEEGAAPLIQVPRVDVEKLEDPSIIDAF